MKHKIIEQWNRFFSVKTVKGAESVIRRIAIGFYILAILNLAIAVFNNNPAVAIDGWVIFSLGATLQHCRSRTIAFLTIPYCLLIICSSVYCQYYLLPNARSVIIAIIGVILGVYAVIATHEYHKLRRSHINWKNGLLKTVQSMVYGIIFLLIATFGIVLPYHDTLIALGGYNLTALISIIVPSIAIFLAFNGWLPFTHNEPACRYDD